jgi:hypothetical protein
MWRRPDVASAIVGHYTLDLDTEAGVIGGRCLEGGDRAALLLVRHDLGEGDAGVIVDADVHVFLADAALITLTSAVVGDAASDLIELAELCSGRSHRLGRIRLEA